MPRPSQAALTVMRPLGNGRVSRLRPPDHLSAPEREVFISIVSSVPAAHFHTSDEFLLCEYVVAVVAAREAAARTAETGGMVTSKGVNCWFLVHERLARRLAVLALRLRLAPSARTRPETVARRAGYRQPSYYEMDPDDA